MAWCILAALTFAAAIFAWAIRQTLRQSESARSVLLRRLLDVRLSGVMQVMGIDPHGYLSQAAMPDVKRQLRACRGCPHQRRCAADLSRAADEERFDYCPSYSSLADVRDALAAT